MKTRKEIMDHEHPRWEEFVNRLASPEGCDFRIEEGGRIMSKCKGGDDKTYAKKIMRRMGGIDIEASVEYFEEHAGFCDCEIIFNVGWDALLFDSEEDDTTQVVDAEEKSEVNSLEQEMQLS